jgi:predicted cation transporter
LLLVIAAPNGAVGIAGLRDFCAFVREWACFRDAQRLAIEVTLVGPSVTVCNVLQGPATMCTSIIKVLVGEKLILEIRMMRIVRKEKTATANFDAFAVGPGTCSSKSSQNATPRGERGRAP